RIDRGAVDGGVGDGRIERDRVKGAVVAGIDPEVQALDGDDRDAGQAGDRLRREVGRVGDGDREQLAVFELDRGAHAVGDAGIVLRRRLGECDLPGDVDGAGERRHPAAQAVHQRERLLRRGLPGGRKLRVGWRLDQAGGPGGGGGGGGGRGGGGSGRGREGGAVGVRRRGRGSTPW